MCRAERSLLELQRANERRRRESGIATATLAAEIGALPLVRSRLRLLHAARSEMHHLVSVLRGYVLGEVLEGGWARMQSQLRQARCWTHVRDTHTAFVTHIVRACFRSAPTVAGPGSSPTPSPSASMRSPSAASSASASSSGGGSGSGAAAAHSTTLISSAIDKILDSVLDFKSRLAQAPLHTTIPAHIWQGQTCSLLGDDWCGRRGGAMR